MTGLAKKKTPLVVSIIEDDNGYGLLQGEHPVLTPTGNVLRVPSVELAEALADEIRGGSTVRKMCLVALALTAQDRIAPAVEEICDALLDYARTDTLCYRDEKPELAARQRELWDPLLAWGKERYGAELSATDSLLSIDQSEESLAALKRVLMGFSIYELAALSILTQIYASLLLALAVKEGVTDAEQAFGLSRLEARFQAERWGEDEEAQTAARNALSDVLLAQHFLRLTHAQSKPRKH